MENKYFLANSLNLAVAKAREGIKGGYKVVGIEAEYGDKDISDVISGVISLSHHGNKSDNLPPCERWDLRGQFKDNTLFIFSHLDADSVLGWMICEGTLNDTPDNRTITNIIGYIDVNGPHKAHEHPQYHQYRDVIVSIILSIAEHRRDVSNDNFTEVLRQVRDEILKILRGDRKIIVKYVEKSKQDDEEAFNALDKNLSIKDKLHVFIAHKGFGYKYVIEHPQWISSADCTLQYNTKFNAVTLACADELTATRLFGDEGVIGPLKEFFGEGSGGRIAIGGSPRDKKIEYDDFLKFRDYIANILTKKT